MIEDVTSKPNPLRGPEVDFGTSVASSIWRKIVNNHSWVEKSIPIGTVLFFHESITEADGTPKDLPNPDIWHPCDGSVISDSESPLDGQVSPDLRGLFPKGGNVDLLNGGQETIDISHDHGGVTGTTDDREDFVADTGADHPTGSPHFHTIDTRWSSAEPIIPKFFALQAYLRYK